MKFYTYKFYDIHRVKNKVLLSMKISLLLLLSFLTQVNASTFAQRITLSERNASLETVLKKIKSQTGYNMFFIYKDIKTAKPVTIDLKSATLEEALTNSFKNQPLTYTIESN